MPELGKYSAEVLGAYGVTIVLLIMIVVLSVKRARSVRRALEAAETRVRNG